MVQLTDKAVLVTGSTRGIGYAIAEALFAAGARVGIHGRQPDQVRAICRNLDPTGTRTVPVVADFAQPEAARDAVRRFIEATGQLDGLINNAGSGKAAAFRSLTLEKWRNTFRVNLEAAMLAMQAAYVFMRKQRAGSIINMASLAAHGPGKWMGADYAAAKAGLVSLTQSLAFEAARFNIRVNAVSPGMIETDMTTVLPESMRQRLDIPMARLGTPEEVAGVAVFLLSDASASITGEVLHVNGGLWM